ncbi:DUF397 domain-containing protein [Streptosporangium saharense]|uniref:DUF397 domain-containing protein n=1 Tax=Streptosporangium saharense TaxID=1706840 RepID=A0A7W7QMY6_9ACTN|nr:DUF397 domain-containing protein [Streptosporangium saharense]MBB4916551.1 hypothetical protein [Streptosporangium saharense]
MSPDLTGAEFHKSSLSTNEGANCVEVATNLPGLVAVRDSKDPSGPALTFTPAQWRSFIGRVNTGAFDTP